MACVLIHRDLAKADWLVASLSLRSDIHEPPAPLISFRCSWQTCAHATDEVAVAVRWLGAVALVAGLP
jgi:hypothetical protein